MIDLHLHSTFSDGTLTPTELVNMACESGISGLSITDHDTVDGTAESIAAGAACEVTVISGVELSVYLDDFHFHLLGYCFDHQDKVLLEKLALLQDSREKRNSVIIAKLRDLGLDVSDDELKAISSTGQTGRPHIARLMVEKHIVKDIDQAFALYLRKGKKGYAPRFIYEVQEAIDLIHQSGGSAVLAHPAQISRSLPLLDDLLERLKLLGLDGVETYYPGQRGSFLNKLHRLAAKYELIETGGSDYHGDIRPGTAMAGKLTDPVPCQLLEQLDRNHQSKRKAIKR
ncbi:MAG: PHP domain-containing protein [Desulfofustis sp.]|jgi:3',5'-nucleoside bisphosphate phosphatase